MFWTMDSAELSAYLGRMSLGLGRGEGVTEGRMRWSLLACATLLAAGCGSRSRLAPDDESVVLDDETELLVLSCPTGPDDPRLPRIEPGAPVELDATELASGPIASVKWSIVREGCDAVVPQPSFTLQGENTSRATFTPSRPGPHTVRLEVEDSAGERAACEFPLSVSGTGLRVELCWDTSTETDLDLYLHNPDDTLPWFQAGGDVLSGQNPNICNPMNCPAVLRLGASRVNWGYPDSPLELCAQGPSAGAFAALGRCPNPRAGVDNNQLDANGTSEIIRLDNPNDGDTFRIMVQNFDNGAGTPQVYVHCGAQQTSFSLEGTEFTTANPGSFGPMWRVADVTAHVDARGVLQDCSVEHLVHPRGQGPFVTINDPSY